QCDHLGTPMELTDEQGNVAWAGQYKAWGEVREERSDWAKQHGLGNPIRFQGQYHDHETGLHYNRYRYYDPNVGRFVSKDPIGYTGGINLYEYAPNSVEWTDPLGLCRYLKLLWQVGTHKGNKNCVKGLSLGLDSHHVGQKNLMKDLVKEYDPDTAPTILVPREGHTISKEGVGIVSRSKLNPKAGLPFTNARDLVARDIKELRRVYPDIPNGKLQELIRMNKEMYPELRK
ncbi:RHS repeat-associated core domain-containing protein, partial [Pseudomonas sp. VA159-2]